MHSQIPFIVWDIFVLMALDFFQVLLWGWDGLGQAISPSHKLYTSLNAKLNSYNACAIYIIPVTVLSFTPAASIAFTSQTVRALCILLQLPARLVMIVIHIHTIMLGHYINLV